MQNISVLGSTGSIGRQTLAVAEHLGIKREEILAFGDGMNDISMLKTAGIGVAMANACDEAKTAADSITLSCDEDGVARGIEEICFKER